MGLLKKSSGLASHVVMMPLKIAFPDTVRNQYKSYKVEKKKAPFCPSCGVSHLQRLLIDQEEENSREDQEHDDTVYKEEQLATWICPSCKLTIELPDGKIDTLKAWIAENGRDIYENSAYFKMKNSGELDEEINRNIKLRIYTARALLGISIFFVLVFFYACFTMNFLFAVNSILASLCALFIGVVNSYRAWQIKTDNLYAPNPKEQFHQWLSEFKWFNFPDYEEGVSDA